MSHRTPSEVLSDHVAWERISRSGLVEPFASPRDAARALIGAQAQFVPPAGLAIANRVATSFTESELDHGLHESKSLLRLWGQRNTVHVYDFDDWATIVAMHSALPSYRERIARRVGRSDAEFERALARTEELLRHSTRLSRAELAEDPLLAPWLTVNNVLMMDVVRRGQACHAGVTSGRSYFAHRAVWAPHLAWDLPAVEEAGRSLAVRYLATYGPASLRDLTFWLGAKAADARAWLDSAMDDLVEVVGSGAGMFDVPHAVRERLGLLGAGEDAREPPPRSEWPLRLLHRFDPLLLAHKDKSWLIDDDRYKAVWRKAGYVEAVIFRRGRIAGTWGYEKKARGVEIWLAPFAPLPKRERRAWDRQAEAVAAYFERPLLAVAVR